MTSVKRPPVVEVEWVDSMKLPGNWITRERALEDLHDTDKMDHVTCGYLLEKTREYVAVAESLGGPSTGDAVTGVLQIPRGCVRNITVLREAA
jgi:hypothetical protein